MEDVPLAVVKLEAVLLDNYDEGAATAATMAASLAEEEAKWYGQGWRTSSSSRKWWRST
jgi:hypothetical protein